VRRLIVALALLLAACGDLRAGSQAVAPRTPLPTSLSSSTPASSSTPLPSGIVDPQPLVQQVEGMNGIVLRIDDIATKLVSAADYLGPDNVPGPSVNVPSTVWVVAVVGDIAPNFGVMWRPNSPCGLFSFRADSGEIWSAGEGSLAMCQPYFARALTPADAPLRCAPLAYDNGVSRKRQAFSQTRRGPFGFTSIRDDRWRQPTIVPGSFLARAPGGSVPYEDAFCLKALVRQGPAVEMLLASGVGAVVPRAMPPLEWAIWLRGYHAVSGSADAEGHIDVVVEPKAGYEWAFFDWHALVPEGGYVMFRFVDASGHEVLPWRLANGP
jgi:hypothetical protein